MNNKSDPMINRIPRPDNITANSLDSEASSLASQNTLKTAMLSSNAKGEISNNLINISVMLPELMVK